MIAFICNTQEDTQRLGERLARALCAPCLVALYGDLGAGKTALVRGVAQCLGCADVTSPTFNIVHEYDTIPPIFHFDAYRLADGDALLDVGFDEYLRRDGLIFIEWAELVADALPTERINITIYGCGDAPRSMEICPTGARYERMMEALC